MTKAREKKFILVLMAFLTVTYGCALQKQSRSGVPSTIDEVPRITAEELNNRLEEGESVLIVDMRSYEAFNAVHIKGAVSVPIDEIEYRLEEFPLAQAIVFYCS